MTALTYLQAAELLFDLTPEEQAHAKRRRAEILDGGGHVDDAIRLPLEEIAAARRDGGE